MAITDGESDYMRHKTSRLSCMTELRAVAAADWPATCCEPYSSEEITKDRNSGIIWVITEGRNAEHRDYCTCSLLYTDTVYSVYLYTVYVAYCCVSVLCTAGLLS